MVASSHTDEENFKAAALEASSAAAQAEREASSIGSDWCQVRTQLLLLFLFILVLTEKMLELFEFTKIEMVRIYQSKFSFKKSI